ncbi:MAG TPA: aminotransferase class V-fold PLP-dependent enzyme [Longimicrobiaceae bacterium]|nr:aminotransferase class V-fold PLP-dependent enzyme [Longimicrobiaceae bacterium]
MKRLDVERIREDFPILKRQVNGKPLVYLDSAATSQKPRAMIDRIARLYSHDYSRPEEGHSLSREATRAFEGTREKVARLINAAEAREIVFCRGATEALNLMARAFEHAHLEEGDEVLLTRAEHHSNILPWMLSCRQTGARLRVAPVTPDSDVDLEEFERMLTDRVRVAAVSHVSNVTGALYPVKRMVEMAHARGIPVLVDGAQAVPHVPVDVRDIGCDFYAGSGHKMGGPSSVGFLYGRAEWMEKLPVADGGSTMAESVSFEAFEAKPIPHKYEAGEPAFGEVEAWGPAIDYWTALGMEDIAAYEKELTDYAAERVRAIRGVRVLGSPAERIAIVSFVVDGMQAGDVEKALDREGIAVRAGKLAAEPLLRALGTDEAVRASFMFYNTREEADALADALERIARGS